MNSNCTTNCEKRTIASFIIPGLTSHSGRDHVALALTLKNGSLLESLYRGLSSRRFTERFHRDTLVTHFQHCQVCCTAWRLENYAIASCRLHQRAPQRRHPTDVVTVEIDLVCTYDAHHPLRCRGIGIAHSRSKECPPCRLPRSRSFGVNHLRGLDALHEKANPSIDLAKPPLAVVIVGVFTAIAVTGSPRHHLRNAGRSLVRRNRCSSFKRCSPPGVM